MADGGDALGAVTGRRDEREGMLSDTGTLAARLEATLGALGGRTALVAQWFEAPQAARRTVRVVGMGEAGEHEHTHEHGHGSEARGDGARGDGARGDGARETRIELRPDEVFPAASLVKLCVAVELARRADLGQFSLDERFDTADEPRAGGGGVLDYMDPQTRLTLRDLLFLMVGVSDNTAGNFLIELLGMGEINETISRMKLMRTRLARRFMDFAAQAHHRDNLTSAGDMVTLLALIRGGALPQARLIREALAAQQRADDLAAWLPVGAGLAVKTGALDAVFHAAGLLTGPQGAGVFCVLTAEQEDRAAAQVAVGRCLRLLWDGWGLG